MGYLGDTLNSKKSKLSKNDNEIDINLFENDTNETQKLLLINSKTNLHSSSNEMNQDLDNLEKSGKIWKVLRNNVSNNNNYVRPINLPPHNQNNPPINDLLEEETGMFSSKRDYRSNDSHNLANMGNG